MKIAKVFGVLAVALLAGCDDHQIGSVTNRETILVDKEFGATEYEGEYDMYRTEDSPWLCILTYTEVSGGKLSDLHPGLKIAYDATAFDWLYDNMGFRHFVWFADKITIIETVGASQPAIGPVTVKQYPEDSNHILLDNGNYIPLGPK